MLEIVAVGLSIGRRLGVGARPAVPALQSARLADGLSPADAIRSTLIGLSLVLCAFARGPFVWRGDPAPHRASA